MIRQLLRTSFRMCKAQYSSDYNQYTAYCCRYKPRNRSLFWPKNPFQLVFMIFANASSPISLPKSQPHMEQQLSLRETLSNWFPMLSCVFQSGTFRPCAMSQWNTPHLFQNAQPSHKIRSTSHFLMKSKRRKNWNYTIGMWVNMSIRKKIKKIQNRKLYINTSWHKKKTQQEKSGQGKECTWRHFPSKKAQQ